MQLGSKINLNVYTVIEQQYSVYFYRRKIHLHVRLLVTDDLSVADAVVAGPISLLVLPLSGRPCTGLTSTVIFAPAACIAKIVKQ